MPPFTTQDPTVVVIGTTGAGKSSVINMLENHPNSRQMADVGFTTGGVTNKITTYRKMVNTRPIALVDTIGTGEPSSGTIPTHLAVRFLHDYLTSSSIPIHLAMIIQQAGRMTEMEESNYLLARFLFGDEVPIVLVLTHLESEEKDTWWAEQESKGKMTLLPAIGVVSTRGLDLVYEDLYEASKKVLSQFIATKMHSGAGFQVQRHSNHRRLFATFEYLDDANPGKSHNSMLQLLKDFAQLGGGMDDISDDALESVAANIPMARPFPVVFFAGLSPLATRAVINALPGSPGSHAETATNGIRTYIKTLNYERIRVLEAPHLLVRSSDPKSLPLEGVIQAVHDSLLAHPSGIRLAVLVVTSKGAHDRDSASYWDAAHYYLIRQLCSDDVPICLITVRKRNDHQMGPSLPRQKFPSIAHLSVPVSKVSRGLSENTGDIVNAFLSKLLRSGNDYSTGENRRLPDLLESVTRVKDEEDVEKQQAQTQDLFAKRLKDLLKSWPAQQSSLITSNVPHQSIGRDDDIPPMPIENTRFLFDYIPGTDTFTLGSSRGPHISTPTETSMAFAEATPSIHVLPAVVMFGPSGGGKTSLVNMLQDDPRADIKMPQENSATLNVKVYHKMVEGRACTVIDTPGMGARSGVPTHRAVKLVYKHLVKHSSSIGVQLVVIVKQAGRMTSVDDCNYLLARLLFGDDVPIVLAITHHEREFEGDKDGWWWKDRKRGQMTHIPTIAVTSSPGRNGLLRGLYRRSKPELSRFIIAHMRSGSEHKLQHRDVLDEVFRALRRVGNNAPASHTNEAMLQALEGYDIAKLLNPPLSQTEDPITDPLPVVIFIGSPGTEITPIINMFAGVHANSEVALQTRDRVRDSIKIINGKRVRILELPVVQFPSGTEDLSLSPHYAVRLLCTALIAQPRGVRLVVLVSQAADGGPNAGDSFHYRLIRRLSNDVPFSFFPLADIRSPARIPATMDSQWRKFSEVNNAIKDKLTPFLSESGRNCIFKADEDILSNLAWSVLNLEVEFRRDKNYSCTYKDKEGNGDFHHQLDELLSRFEWHK